MRRALLRSLPALTHFYGLRPWEVEMLTFDELREYQRQMADYHRKIEDARRG
ncbi:MAG TPA: hypothetical protein VFJ85_02830 [Acidimicrobiales bacterium]|nr:hypothetical protein [Acidimicrobiales bacterium]